MSGGYWSCGIRLGGIVTPAARTTETSYVWPERCDSYWSIGFAAHTVVHSGRADTFVCRFDRNSSGSHTAVGFCETEPVRCERQRRKCPRIFWTRYQNKCLSVMSCFQHASAVGFHTQLDSLPICTSWSWKMDSLAISMTQKFVIAFFFRVFCSLWCAVSFVIFVLAFLLRHPIDNQTSLLNLAIFRSRHEIRSRRTSSNQYTDTYCRPWLNTVVQKSLTQMWMTRTWCILVYLMSHVVCCTLIFEMSSYWIKLSNQNKTKKESEIEI